RIMIPVHVEQKLFAFHTEPSIHIGMTRDQLTDFIAQNNLNVPTQAVEPMMIHGSNSIYPTPPPSTNEFYVPTPATVHPTTTEPCYFPPNPVSEMTTTFEALHPLPILEIDDVDLFFDPYWTAPAPVIPQSEYQFPPDTFQYFGEY
ncbi:hypothetical protein PENTCL1PPCAC_884, partial [Pristionchus entomophagus]